jgi:hypothetical protein
MVLLDGGRYLRFPLLKLTARRASWHCKRDAGACSKHATGTPKPSAADTAERPALVLSQTIPLFSAKGRLAVPDNSREATKPSADQCLGVVKDNLALLVTLARAVGAAELAGEPVVVYEGTWSALERLCVDTLGYAQTIGSL